MAVHQPAHPRPGRQRVPGGAGCGAAGHRRDPRLRELRSAGRTDGPALALRQWCPGGRGADGAGRHRPGTVDGDGSAHARRRIVCPALRGHGADHRRAIAPAPLRHGPVGGVVRLRRHRAHRGRCGRRTHLRPPGCVGAVHGCCRGAGHRWSPSPGSCSAVHASAGRESSRPWTNCRRRLHPPDHEGREPRDLRR